MSKYTITRKCGHVETINIGGKVSERDRLASYEEEKLCYECWKAKQKADREEASNKAAAEAKTSGLTELKGSEKQVAWAETIRSEIIKNLDRILESVNTDKTKDLHEALSVAINTIKLIDSARWWIDHRDGDIVDGHWDARLFVMRIVYGTTSPSKDHPLFGASAEKILDAIRNFKP